MCPPMPMSRAVLREWEGWQDHESWVGSQIVDTIYFGGGTPSRLDPRGISAILERIASDRHGLARRQR